jgi:regulator of sigma E protease
MDLLGRLSDNFLSIAGIVIGIGFLIFVHELGHFLFAKLHGVRVDIFSLGFGKPILKWKRGVTEYRLAWIPLGGFVKMAGEPLSEERTGAPDELTSKRPGQRFQIFLAGTAMNFIVAFPICIVALLVGRNLGEARLGTIPDPGSPEWEAGLTQGDRIVSAGDTPVDSMDTYKWQVLLARRGQPIPVVVERGDPPQRVSLQLFSRGIEGLNIPPPSNVIASVEKGSPAEQAGLRPDDVILELDGKPVLNIAEIARIVKPNAGNPLPVKILRPSTGETLTLTVTPALWNDKKPHALDLHALDLDSEYEPVVRKIHPLSRAQGNLQEGDRILTINDRSIRSFRDVQEIVEASPEKPLTLTVRRPFSDPQTLTLSCVARRNALGRGTLDIAMSGVNGVCVLGDLPSDSPSAIRGAKKGDRVIAIDGRDATDVSAVQRYIEKSISRKIVLKIRRIDGKEEDIEQPILEGPDGNKKLPLPLDNAYPLIVHLPKSWPLYAAGAREGDRVLRVDIDGKHGLVICRSLIDLELAAARGKPFPIEVEREDQTIPLTVTPDRISYGAIQIAPRVQTVLNRLGIRQAVIRGSRSVFNVVQLTFVFLGRIITGKEKGSSSLSGPVGVFHISYTVIKQGFGNFLWLLGVIAVSLAIFNLFPIPILDGGHILFLLIEKIRGKPVSDKTMIIAQYVGLSLLVLLLVYVTSNDITRLIP